MFEKDSGEWPQPVNPEITRDPMYHEYSKINDKIRSAGSLFAAIEDQEVARKFEEFYELTNDPVAQ